MKTILVPTDFSPNAVNALQYAAALASQVNAKLIIAHIVNLPVTSMADGMMMPPDAEAEVALKEQLNQIARKLEGENKGGPEIETILEYGYFLANLTELVKTQAVDLVVMGTRGATNFLDKLVGTNTAGFIKVAPCPVLAIPDGATFNGINKIAYASDFESEEDGYLHQLFGVAEPLQAEVAIINILTERQLNIFADNQVVRHISQRYANKNCSIAQIQEKDVVQGLQAFVQDVQAEVLAVAMHKRGLVESLFHKSISKQLFYQAALPLLALPEKPNLSRE